MVPRGISQLFQEAFEAGGDHLAGFFRGEEAFEDAEVYVNGEVVVGDEDGTGDGSADHIQRAHSGD